MIEKHIGQLLFEHEFVIIPGFGGFITRHKSAEVHPITHKFQPPSKTLAFNEQLKLNDGLLISTVSKLENLPLDRTALLIKEFVQSVTETLKNQRQFILNGIGRLFYNRTGQLEFEPESKLNYLEDSFGLTELFFKPIERNTNTMSKVPPRPVKKTLKENSENKPDSREPGQQGGGTEYEAPKKSYRNALIILPIILLLAGLSGVFYMKQQGKSLASLFPSGSEETEAVLKDSTSAKVNVDSLGDAEAANALSSKPAPEPEASAPAAEDEPDVTELKKQERHYVVVASFTSKSNALKLKRKLNDSGRKAKIVKVPGENLYRVSVLDFYDRNTAVINMEILKTYYGDTIWVLSY